MSLLNKPLIVNSDYTVLLEVNSPAFDEARDSISPFLELIKSPELFYTYKLNEISLWNGFSLGLDADTIIERLSAFVKFPIPEIVLSTINDNFNNYGFVKLLPTEEEGQLLVHCEDRDMLHQISHTREMHEIMIYDKVKDHFTIPEAMRGVFKLEMIKLSLPVEDKVGFVNGDPLDITVQAKTSQGHEFSSRPYQVSSIDAFLGAKDKEEGAGIVVLPCGAGKTIVGILAMARLKMKTLIIAPNVISLRQWKRELLDKTNLTEDDIGEYSGEEKVIKPVTMATYQILVYRKSKKDAFQHLGLFTEENWGLIIYDEIHLLPAPIFRAIAGIQARRRLGLTATLVREDGKERDVFALIGPKKFDLPWKELEQGAYIAEALCYEIKVPMSDELMRSYYGKSEKSQFRLAAENPHKTKILANLLETMENAQVLIIGQYIDQLEKISAEFGIPLITGKTNNQDRQVLYDQFKTGKLNKLVVSKVANFAIDLPDANVAIQVSGTFGSRQEEAQRLGRILRPKDVNNRSYFFNIVSLDSREELYAQNRKRFLMEQGYQYELLYESDLDHPDFLGEIRA